MDTLDLSLYSAKIDFPLLALINLLLYKLFTSRFKITVAYWLLKLGGSCVSVVECYRSSI